MIWNQGSRNDEIYLQPNESKQAKFLMALTMFSHFLIDIFCFDFIRHSSAA